MEKPGEKYRVSRTFVPCPNILALPVLQGDGCHGLDMETERCDAERQVILDLADPLLDGDASDPKEVDLIVQLTIAAWNKAMLPADRQAATEKKVIDILVRADGDAEQVAAVIQAMEIVDERRRKLFPNLRPEGDLEQAGTN